MGVLYNASTHQTVWALFDEGRSVDAIVRSVAALYKVGPQEARRIVERALTQKRDTPCQNR